MLDLYVSYTEQYDIELSGFIYLSKDPLNI